MHSRLLALPYCLVCSTARLSIASVQETIHLAFFSVCSLVLRSNSEKHNNQNRADIDWSESARGPAQTCVKFAGEAGSGGA